MTSNTRVDIVFDGPPSHVAGRFVEVEDASGASIKLGEWLQREDGYWVLRFDLVAALIAEGGETIWWCETEERMMAMEPDVPWGVHDCSAELGCGWRLVFGPIPVESAEAKET